MRFVARLAFLPVSFVCLVLLFLLCFLLLLFKSSGPLALRECTANVSLSPLPSISSSPFTTFRQSSLKWSLPYPPSLHQPSPVQPKNRALIKYYRVKIHWENLSRSSRKVLQECGTISGGGGGGEAKQGSFLPSFPAILATYSSTGKKASGRRRKRHRAYKLRYKFYMQVTKDRESGREGESAGSSRVEGGGGTKRWGGLNSPLFGRTYSTQSKEQQICARLYQYVEHKGLK